MLDYEDLDVIFRGFASLSGLIKMTDSSLTLDSERSAGGHAALRVGSRDGVFARVLRPDFVDEQSLASVRQIDDFDSLAIRNDFFAVASPEQKKTSRLTNTSEIPDQVYDT